MEVTATERLRFELVTEQDAQDLFELDSDPEVMRYVKKGQTTPMNDIVNKFLPRIKQYTNRKFGWGMYKAIDKQNDEFLGWILVRPFDFFTDDVQWHNLEVGWRFKQKSWGKGYATEAAKAVCDALANLYSVKVEDAPGQVTMLSAIADEDNLGSTNIMTKLGMKYIKSYMYELPTGEKEPVVYYERSL